MKIPELYCCESCLQLLYGYLDGESEHETQLAIAFECEADVDDTLENPPGPNEESETNSKDDGIRRPFRLSSLFTGFDGASSNKGEDIEADLSDDDYYRALQYSTPMMSSRNLKHGRPFNNPPTPVPEDKEVVSTSQTSEDSAGPRKMYSSSRNSFEKASKVAKPLQSAGLIRRPRSGRQEVDHCHSCIATESSRFRCCLMI